MVKKWVIKFYIPMIALKRRLFNFIFPKFFSGKKFKAANIPTCQQKVLITGKGEVIIGENCAFGSKLGGFYKKGYIELQARTQNAVIRIGDRVSTNNNLFICSARRIEIGSETLIGQNVTMMDFEAHGTHPDKRREVGNIGEIVICNNVWIGNNVTILRDTHIGENSIIAAGAIVKGVFPKNVIIGGVPAKIIKNINLDARE
jgi:acetyltransferase-like isoleucine patch superfamily enzyme